MPDPASNLTDDAAYRDYLNTQTPEQIQQLVNQPGTPGAQQDQYQQPPPLFDMQPQNAYSSPGAGEEPGAADQRGPLSYGSLVRDTDGNLQGAGPGMEYNRQAILQRAFDAGQLPPMSDQGMEAAQQQREIQSDDLHSRYASSRLTTQESQRLTQIQYGLQQISNRVTSGSLSALDGQRMTHIAQAQMAPLMAKQAMSERLGRLVAVKDAHDQAAMAKALQVKNSHVDSETAQQRTAYIQAHDGTMHTIYTDPQGRTHIIAAKADTAGGVDKAAAADVKAEQAAHSHYDKIYGETYKRTVEQFQQEAGKDKEGKVKDLDWGAVKSEFEDKMKRIHGMEPTWVEERKKMLGGKTSAGGFSSEGAGMEPGAAAAPQEPQVADLTLNTNEMRTKLLAIKDEGNPWIGGAAGQLAGIMGKYPLITAAPPEVQQQALKLHAILKNHGKIK